MLSKAYIPYKGYYSSPFSRWQGSMANENSIELAAGTAKRWLAEKNGVQKFLIIYIWELPFTSIAAFTGAPGRRP